MTATMTAGVLADTWDVTCTEHHLDQRGLAQAHAVNAVAKHNRDQHAVTLHLARLATLVLVAQEYADVTAGALAQVRATHGFGAEQREAYAERNAAASQRDATVAAWLTLLGLSLAELPAALDLAREYAGTDVTAHVAPF